jgi:ankyrin repeat protein
MRRAVETETETETETDAESDGDDDDDDDGSSTSQTELFGAIEDGDHDAFERALREDAACVKDVNSNGWTAAHQAAYSGEHKMLRRVLELGVDVNARCADGCLAAHYASAQGEKKCLQVLGELGSEFETKDKDGESPLDVCTRGVRELLADLIVEARKRNAK